MVPRTVPMPPTAVKVEGDSARVIVSWESPADTGGRPVTSSKVIASPDGRTCTANWGSTTCTLTGFVPGRKYTLTVTSTNEAGSSPPSQPVTFTPWGAVPVESWSPGRQTRVAAGHAIRIRAGSPFTTVLGNLTVTEPATSGFTTAYPCASGIPRNSAGQIAASVNNFVAGQTIPNFAAVRTDSGGDICVYTSATAHLLWDQTSESDLAAGVPKRITDTRTIAWNYDSNHPAATGTRLPAGRALRITAGAPNSTVMGNLTVTEPAGSGFTTAYPCAEGRPNTSVNNFVAGQTIPNFAAVRTDNSGAICIYTSAAAHIIWDQTSESSLPANTAQRLTDTRTGNWTPVDAGFPQGVSLWNVSESPSGGPANETAAVVFRKGNRACFEIIQYEGFTMITTIEPAAGGFVAGGVVDHYDERGQTPYRDYFARQGSALTSVSNDGGYRWVAQWSPTDQTTAAQRIANHIRVPTATAHAIISQSKATNESACARMGYDVVVASGQTMQIRAGAPNTTVLGNLTITEAQGSGFTTIFPCAGGRPFTSVNNFVTGQTIPNFTAVRTDGNGDICIYTSAGAHIIWDQTSQSQLPAGTARRLMDTRT